MGLDRDQLLEKLRSGAPRVGVIGLGYVGLPLSLAFASKGISVVGFDIDDDKNEALARGESYLTTVAGPDVKSAIDAGRFSATADFSKLAKCDVILICVPTPLGESREPDLKYVRMTAEQVAGELRAGQLVVLESTTYPGTTEEVLRDVLERSGLKCGKDFFVAFSPEREDPGNPDYTTSTIPKLVGGLDDYSSELTQAIYERAFRKVVRVAHARVAEAAKLLENVYRAVNIALVNELKVVFEAMNLDVWDVIDAAATKPFGFQAFYPGPGLGGHCIPIDPFYLTWRARHFGMSTRFIELAGEINAGMPQHVISRVQDALNEQGKAVKGSKVLVLGVAYKGGVSDTRESPGIEIIDQLLLRGAKVEYYDPLVKKIGKMRDYDLSLASIELSAERVKEADAVLMVTEQPGMDLALIAEHASVIVDSRNAFRNFPGARVVRA